MQKASFEIESSRPKGFISFAINVKENKMSEIWMLGN